MNDQVNTPEDQDNDIAGPDEMALLKERAVKMGIKISGNIGLDTLKKRIADQLEGKDSTEEGEGEKPITKKAQEQTLRQKIQEENLALVRCRIYNLNPGKRDLQGEIITVGNKYLGTIRKFIPFGEQTENGYHIPMCIYNDLKARKFQHIRTKTVKGQIEVDRRMAPEYNIEVMEPLTSDELAELALKQSAAERLGA